MKYQPNLVSNKMHISVYVLFIMFCSLTFVHADPDVEYGKPSEGSYANTRLRRNNDIEKEHLQRLERFIEFRKRLKQRENRQAPNSGDSHEENPVDENGGRTAVNHIDEEHLQKIKRILELRKSLSKQREKEWHAPGSNDNHEGKPAGENGGRPPGIVKQTNAMQEADMASGVKDASETIGGITAPAHRNNGSPEGISVVPLPGETSLLADKMWIFVAVCSGVCFVMVVLCCCFYKCLVLIRSRVGMPRYDDAINITGNEEIAAGWGSDEDEVLNVPDYKREREQDEDDVYTDTNMNASWIESFMAQ